MECPSEHQKKAAWAHANVDPNPPPLQSGYQPASQLAIRNHCTATTHLIPPLWHSRRKKPQPRLTATDNTTFRQSKHSNLAPLIRQIFPPPPIPNFPSFLLGKRQANIPLGGVWQLLFVMGKPTMTGEGRTWEEILAAIMAVSERSSIQRSG